MGYGAGWNSRWSTHPGGVPMVNLISFFREQFRFTTTRYMEPRYYRQPLWRSPYFRNNTIAMAGALLVGLFTALIGWRAMPWLACLFLLLSLMGVIGVWVRTIVDHGRMRKRLYEARDELGSEELLRVAAGGANFGPSAMYIIVLMLVFALAFTIAHFQALLSAMIRVCGK